jgi:hypothetical protein
MGSIAASFVRHAELVSASMASARLKPGIVGDFRSWTLKQVQGDEA